MAEEKKRTVILTEDQYTTVLFDLVELNRVAKESLLYENDPSERAQTEKEIEERKTLIEQLKGKK